MIQFFSGIGLTDLILYVVNGFIFTGIWRFIYDRPNKHNLGDHLLSCLVCGFCLCAIYSALPVFDNEAFPITSCAVSAVLAFALAKTSSSKYVEDIFTDLDIRTTYPGDFWIDVQDKRNISFWIEAEYRGNLFYGEVELIESHERYPQITLVYYKRTDLDGNIVEDYTKDGTQKFVLDTAKCDTIKLLYKPD